MAPPAVVHGATIMVVGGAAIWLYYALRRPAGSAIRGALGLALIADLCLFDFFVMRYTAHRNYFSWFLENGSVIALGFSIISAVWEDLNIDTALIAAYPPRFIAGCAWLAGACWTITGMSGVAFGTLVRQNKHAGPLQTLSLISESLVMLVLMLLIALIVTLWCLAVAPILYFVHLVAGAPARSAAIARADRLMITRNPDGDLEFDELAYGAPLPKDEPSSGKRSVEVSFTKRPVTLTSALAAGLIWVAKTSAVFLHWH